jgi:hypothetical protein
MYHTLVLPDVQQLVGLLTLYDGSVRSLFVMTCVTWLFALLEIAEPSSCTCATSPLPHSHCVARIRLGSALALTLIHPTPPLALLAAYEIHAKYAPSPVFFYDRVRTFP